MAAALTLDAARALRDGGIDAIAALNEAVKDVLDALPPSGHGDAKLAFGRAMAGVIDETVNPAVRAYPDLDPDEATWVAVVKARAATRAGSTAMPLYTFVLEFEGGTYVSQVAAQSFEFAPAAWANNLVPGAIRGMQAASLGELRSAMSRCTPVQVVGVSQTWCATASVRGRLALVHFVETCHATNRPK